ncbi:sugar kinase [uncultured Jatrophihabitans sp.]|uniref:sugar kinase n=1 Tax=uncultured Jatrophihabitans sp. TaxID=1610747 RepID=UPI0035C95411
MSVLQLRPAAECRYDVVSLGEVMLRLDPGDGRVRTARQFAAWEGGGEYNVARGLRRCFGQRAAVVTSLVDNEVGRLIEDFMLTGGVDVSHVLWRESDGIGRTVRNGLNFTERGYGVRGAKGTSDRGHTATAAFKVGEVDWDDLFGRAGARWLHTGGIFAGLSETTPDVAEEAMIAAQRHGTRVSYDLNFRPSLWSGIGGPDRAQEVNRRLARHVDVMIGNEEDFSTSLGFDVPDTADDLSSLDAGNFRRMLGKVTAEYPNFEVVATTLRAVRTALRNDWGAIAWADGEFVEAVHRPDLDILDRVGGGDSFASGLIFGILDGRSLAEAVELGAAHGALAMTTPGDTSMATLAEVEAVAAGGSARVQR